MTTVAGRGLTSNGYDARRQLNPEELKTFLRPLYESLLQEIGYVAAVPLNTDAVAKLHKVMQQKADATGLDYLTNPISAKGFSLGLSLACVRLLFIDLRHTASKEAETNPGTPFAL